jgi:hypothetical protein
MSEEDYTVQFFLIFLIVFQGSTNEVYKNEVYKNEVYKTGVYKFFGLRYKFIKMLNALCT